MRRDYTGGEWGEYQGEALTWVPPVFGEAREGGADDVVCAGLNIDGEGGRGEVRRKRGRGREGMSSREEISHQERGGAARAGHRGSGEMVHSSRRAPWAGGRGRDKLCSQPRISYVHSSHAP
jgi:hypothetical protein